jgi:hypothetical protein
MGQTVRSALKLGSLYGAFAPLVGIFEVSWAEQWNSLAGQSDDNLVGALFLSIGFAGIVVLAFLILFVTGFIVGLVREISRQSRTDGPMG